ncbi:MAG: gfo/Idh/MocA family oxidoreductase, partial [Nitratireductor sp.]
MERGSGGPVARHPAGADPLSDLLAPADPRHHFWSREMSAQETPVRVLVAGLGNMGMSHALAYHANPGFEIVGLVSRSKPDLPDALKD